MNNSTKEELNNYLPCPFCGHECNDDYLEISGDKYSNDFSAHCGYCGAKAERGDTVEEAITNWNTRAAVDSSEFLRGYMAAKIDIVTAIKFMKNTENNDE